MSEPVAVLLVAAGAGLVYAAVTNQNPVTELRTALSTGKVDGRPEATAGGFGIFARLQARIAAAITDAATAGPSGSSSAPATAAPAVVAGADVWPDDPTNLVAIGQGGHRLAAPAAAKFAEWETVYGRRIPVTDSYRSSAQQRSAGGASGNNRYASPSASAHVEGRAVDVNLGALGITVGPNPASWMQDARYASLARAAAAAGWCNYQLQRGSTNGKVPEPWHFSYEVCK